MATITAKANNENRTVEPVAKLNAAPGLRMNVSWSNEPMIFTGSRLERAETAHDFVARSIRKVIHAQV
jgi:hypothetical protein